MKPLNPFFNTSLAGIIVMILLFSVTVNAQNLIINPSLEKIKGNPVDIGGFEKVQGWKGIFSADHFNSATTRKNKYRLESFSVIPYQPKTGSSYAGFRIQNNYSEYLLVKLRQKLEKGRKYAFKMYLYLSDKSTHKVNNIGVHFSENEKDETSISHCYAHINISKKNGVVPTGNWEVFGGMYKATGNEKYITIGSFHNPVVNELIKKQESTDDSGQLLTAEAYYYIDDISLVAIPEQKQEKNKLGNEGEVIPLQTVSFDGETDVLLPTSFPELDKVVDALTKKSDIGIEIGCHTNQKSTDLACKQLSERRAKNIAQYFIVNGIAANRITYNGHGNKAVKNANTNTNKAELVIYSLQ